MEDIELADKRKAILELMEQEWDMYEFNHVWLQCIIIRYRWHWNWYVLIDNTHKYFWATFNDTSFYNIDVHWWVTYSWTVDNLNTSGKYKWLYAIWFDTAHAWDAFVDTPLPEEHQDIFLRWEYRDKEFAIEQTKLLAEQLLW